MAYRLGKLTSLDALLGQQIDVRARELEAAARTGAVLPEADELETRTREALRQLWTRSKTGRAAFEARPNRVTMLRSLYMDQDTQPETDRLNQKAGPSMQGLLATSHWERLRACGDAGSVEVPDFASFAHDGVKVFAAPDLAYVHEGVLHVIDWKTGRADDTQPMQVLLQMWWALETYPALAQAAADGSLEIRGYLEYVAAGSTQPVEAVAGLPRAGRRDRARRRRPDARPAGRPGAEHPARAGRLRAPRERALPHVQLRAGLRVRRRAGGRRPARRRRSPPQVDRRRPAGGRTQTARRGAPLQLLHGAPSSLQAGAGARLRTVPSRSSRP